MSETRAAATERPPSVRHSLASVVLIAGLLLGLTASLCAVAADPAQASSGPITLASLWGGDDQVELSFEEVFDKPFYREGYFPWTLLVGAVIVAGVVSYATAGAGAPAAATGVSSVASAVGGGGAGSYMAGLSTIGGWFGGNAMVGAAILNGLSLGLGGGSTAWAALSAMGKVGVLIAVSASALDGVLLFTDPESKELSHRIILPVPQNFGTPKANRAAEDITEAVSDAIKAAKKGDPCALEEAEARRERAVNWSRLLADAAIDGPASPEYLIVIAVLRKNAGDSEHFQKLIQKIRRSEVSNQSYLLYLKAIASIENGDLEKAEEQLWASWDSAPYAIEPPILLVNLLGYQDFEKNEEQILFIVNRAAEQFDDGEYDTPYSLLALNYRLATYYFNNERFGDAERYYRQAYKEIPALQKYFGEKVTSRLVMLGIANALYAQDKTSDADEIVNELLSGARTLEDKDAVRFRYLKYAGLEQCATPPKFKEPSPEPTCSD